VRRALIAVGAALIAVALIPPLATWGEERSFAAHMAQHLLLGDLAPLVLAVAFMPRLPVVPAAAALPVWIGNLAVWHIPAVMEAALHHGAVHVAQHLCLFAAGLLLWCAILSSELGVGARLGIVAGMMATGIALSSVLIWWPRVLYSTYTHADILGGLSPLTDQRTGGGLMLVEGMLVGLGAAAWLILGLLRDGGEGSSEERVRRSQSV
jgi:putative membrane protein